MSLYTYIHAGINDYVSMCICSFVCTYECMYVSMHLCKSAFLSSEVAEHIEITSVCVGH